jgi:hypothetical protein
MAISAILAQLVKTYGPILAEKLWDRFNNKNNESKLENALIILEKGASVTESLKSAFGEAYFFEVLNSITHGNNPTFSYEAGCKEYIEVFIEDEANTSIKLTSLREELNINLDRIIAVYGNKRPEILPYFKGTFSKWMERHKLVLQ